MSLPRYPRYRDSGLGWLARVPAEWPTTRTKHVVRFTTGWTPPTGDAASFEGSNLWANISDLGPRTIQDTEKRISDAAISTSRIKASPKGSLLFSFKLSIGQVSFAGQDMFTNEAIATFLPSPDLSLNYAYYAFPFLLVQNAAENIYGAKLLNQELIRSARFALPSLKEQTCIAAFLDRETAKIDGLVEEQRRLMELLAEKRQAVISHAVTKGLNPGARMKASGVRWLGDVPAHWGIVQSRRLFAVRNEPARDSDQQLTASQKYGVIPQAKFMELEGRRVVQIIKGADSLMHAEPNDFVISLRSFQGGIEWCRGSGSITFHYVVLRPVKGVFHPFFAHLFKSFAYIQALRSTTDLIRDGQDLRYSHFVQISLPLVPMEEQTEIASFLDGMTAQFDALSQEAQHAIDLLQERRAALISAAVTGEIDVRALSESQAA